MGRDQVDRVACGAPGCPEFVQGAKEFPEQGARARAGEAQLGGPGEQPGELVLEAPVRVDEPRLLRQTARSRDVGSEAVKGLPFGVRAAR